jgi:hypothetical protein
MAKKKTITDKIKAELKKLDVKYKNEEENLIARDAAADQALIKLFEVSEVALEKIEEKKKELATLIKRSKVEDKINTILEAYYPSGQSKHKARKTIRLSEIWQESLRAIAKTNNSISKKLKSVAVPKLNKADVLETLNASKVGECLTATNQKATQVGEQFCYSLKEVATSVREHMNVSVMFNDLIEEGILHGKHIRELKRETNKDGQVEKKLGRVTGARSKGKRYVYLKSGLK